MKYDAPLGLSARTQQRFFVLLFLLMVVTAPISAQDPWSNAIISMTGKQLVSRLKDDAIKVIRVAGEEGKSVAAKAAGELNTVASTLEKALGDDINKPLTELRETFEQEVERGIAAFKHPKTS